MYLDVLFLLFSRDSIITQYECICRKLSYSGKDLFFRQIVCIVVLILYICIYKKGSIEVPLRIVVPSVWASLLLFYTFSIFSKLSYILCNIILPQPYFLVKKVRATDSFHSLNKAASPME